MVEGVKRPYRSRVREDGARRTRALIRGAAADMFLRDGYGATSMKRIAAEAGVAERTLYLAFPTKAALLNEVVGVAVAGDDHEMPLSEREGMVEILGSDDAVRIVALFAALTTDLYERAGDLLVLGEQAAESDAELSAFADRGADATLVNIRAVVGRLSGLGGLVPGLSVGEAADVVYAVSHFSVHHLLRRRRRWSRDRYRSWLTRTIEVSILADSARR